jgi:hypothetical protein
VATSAEILIEQVVVLVNVSALGGRQFTPGACTFDLSGNTLRIEMVELASDRSARLAGGKRPRSRIAIVSGRTATTLEHPGQGDHKNNR